MKPPKPSASRRAALLTARSGAIALTTAFLAIPLMIAVIAGVNFARAEIAKERLQTALDSAALTLARELDDSDNPRAVVQAYLDANLKGVLTPEDVTFTVSVDDALNGKTAKIRASATVDILFAKFYGFDDISFALGSEAAFALQDIEVSLVLDVSGSMNGARLANMKQAAKDFLDILLADNQPISRTFVNVIPYSGNVHLGSGFTDYLDPSVSAATFSGCLDTGSEIMDDALIAEDAYAEIDPSYIRWGGFGNTWCPPDTAAAQFHRNDREPLKTFIENMDMGDGTGTDVAIAWGLKTLSPSWRGQLPGGQTDRPSDYGQGAVKALIVMTDGRITDQWRPDGSGGHTQAYNRSTAETNFTNVCNLAKSRPGLTVYAVGFEVPNASMLTLLRNCATDEAKYFETSGTGLSDVFSLIARQLTELRLTK